MNEGSEDQLTELIHELQQIKFSINRIEKRLRTIEKH